MTSIETSRAAFAAAVQLTPVFDAERLSQELAALAGRHWPLQRIHTPGGGLGDPATTDWRVLPLRSPGGDPMRTDPGGPGPDDYTATHHLRQVPYLKSILDRIPAPLHAVRLMALGPGAACAPHSDPKYRLDRGFARLHLPLATHPGAVLVLDGVKHCWQPGALWWGDFSRTHHVSNTGPATRVHTVIDVLLTEELTTWFPPEWRGALAGDDVLLNHFPLATTAPTIPPHTAAVPHGFTDFDHDQPWDGPLRAVQLHRADGHLMLTTTDRRFALSHLRDNEYRFAGWSEQRTLQLLPTGLILRARRGNTCTQRHLPAAPATG